MINFRFHVVSLVAVFLALAVGIVVGSTIVDQAVVDGLQSQLDRIEVNAAEALDENERLKSVLDRFEGYLESNAPFAVEGRLDGSAVVIVAERGVDEDAVDHQLTLVVAAGAAVPAVVWLEPKLVLASESDAERLAAILGLTAAERDGLATSATRALAERLAQPVPVDATPTTAAPAPGVFEQLVDAGFVSVDGDGLAAYDTSSATARRAFVIGGGASKLVAQALLAPLAAALDAAGIETVVGEVHADRDDPDAGDRGTLLAPVIAGDLGTVVATVDNVDEVQGRISMVLALDEVTRGIVGHYGFGSGARRSTPERSTE
jgi:hypothetical protein